MIKKINHNTLLLTLSILTLALMGYSNDAITGEPLSAAVIGVSVAGGGCSNCYPLGEFPGLDNLCETRCRMPLAATVENLTDAPLLVEVILELNMPRTIACDNGDDRQAAEYLIPGLGSVVIEFPHRLLGYVVGADFSAKATVVDGDHEGDNAHASIFVTTAWKICPKPMPR